MKPHPFLTPNKVAAALVIALILFYVSISISPVFFPWFDFSDAEATKLTVTAHRGASGLAPENTLSSIAKALDLNTERIEIDVQQTKDNVVVVLHDRTIDRTTDGKGSVREMTYAEILEHSAGIKFGEQYRDEKVPTLDEALLLVDGKAKLVIEIKSGGEYYPGIERRLVDLIREHGALNWTMVDSFNDGTLEKIHELDGEIALIKLLLCDLPFLPVFIDFGFNIGSLTDYEYVDEFGVHYLCATRDVVEEVHGMGKRLNVWTVNDPELIKRLASLGVDGVLTDYPNY